MNLLRFLVIVVLFAAFVAGAISVLDMGADIGAAVRTVSPGVLLVVLALATLNYVLRFIRWHTFLTLLGERVPRMASLVAYIAGFAFTATPGKAGEAGRSLFLKPYGVTHARTVTTCMVERLFDLAVVTLLSGLAAAAYVEFAPVIVIGAAILLLALVAVRLNRLNQALLSLLRRAARRFSQRLDSTIDRSMSDVVVLFGPRAAIAGLSLGLAGWVCEGLAFWYLLDEMGFPLPWELAAGIYMLALLVGALSFLPGGLVATEVSLLALLIAQGAPRETALLATVAVRVCTLGYSILLGGLALAAATLQVRARQRAQA